MGDGTIRVIFRDGPRAGEELSFSKDRILLGRAAHCDVVFDSTGNNAVSREHAFIERTDAGWRLTDCSMNGTFYFDDRLLKGASRILMEKESLRLSRNGPRIEVILPPTPLRAAPESPGDAAAAGPGPVSSGPVSSISLTKIIPLSRKGETRSLRENPVFIPGLLTVLCGLALFVLLQSILKTGARELIYLYEIVLGLYLGAILVYVSYRSVGRGAPRHMIVLPALFTATAIVLIVNRYGEYLRFPVIRDLMETKSLLPAFAGHFVGAGLFEELLKSIPVWIAALFAGFYSRRGKPGFQDGKMLPSAAVVIGSSSAAGFIVVETLLQYVPMLQSQTEVAMGLMLLVPRFITGISGHVAWSGIFAYFISIALIYRKWRAPLLVLAGWVTAAVLHGLWNACAVADMQALGAVVSLVSFIVFLMYINYAGHFRRK